MYVYQQRDALLNIQNLTAVTITGSLSEDTLGRIERDPGSWQFGGHILEPVLIESTEDSGRALGAVRINLEGNLYDEDLTAWDGLFDVVCGYYQMPLRDGTIRALFGAGEAPVYRAVDVIHLLRRTGANDRIIAQSAGVDAAGIDDWEDGNVPLDVQSLGKLEKAWPLLPWELIVSCLQD